jgi:hypothetical protein
MANNTFAPQENAMVGKERGSSPKIQSPLLTPKKPFWQLAGEILEHGGPGYLQFAITNICNAKCDFCGFAADKFDR